MDHVIEQGMFAPCRRKSIGGSLIGGIKETQEMLDFCGKHNITSDVSCRHMNCRFCAACNLHGYMHSALLSCGLPTLHVVFMQAVAPPHELVLCALQIEEIPATYLNEAMQRMLKSDVHYRFVIDVQGSMVQ